MQQNLDVWQVKIPRDTDVTPEMAEAFLSTFPKNLKYSLIDKWFKGKRRPVLALEVGVWQQRIRFMVVCSPWLSEFVKMQDRKSVV